MENRKIAELIPEETKSEVYNDGFKPTVKQLGKTISLLPRVINSAFAKVEMWCMNKEFMVENFKRELEEKLSKKKESDIIEANPRVFLPAAQAISYSWDENEIKNLYINLMISDMDINKKEYVHPSFIEVIKQMDIVDARLFTELYNNQCLPVYRLSKKENNGGNTSILPYLLPAFYYNISSERVIIKSLNNLERLKLIDIRLDENYVNKNNYLSIENSELLAKYKKEYTDTLEIQEGVIVQTEFGLDFFKTCCK